MADFETLKDARTKSAVDKAALGTVKLQCKVFEVLKGCDVFTVLPTGYGKAFVTVVFICKCSKPSIVYIISPLTAIIED